MRAEPSSPDHLSCRKNSSPSPASMCRFTSRAYEGLPERLSLAQVPVDRPEKLLGGARPRPARTSQRADPSRGGPQQRRQHRRSRSSRTSTTRNGIPRGTLLASAMDDQRRARRRLRGESVRLRFLYASFVLLMESLKAMECQGACSCPSASSRRRRCAVRLMRAFRATCWIGLPTHLMGLVDHIGKKSRIIRREPTTDPVRGRTVHGGAARASGATFPGRGDPFARLRQRGRRHDRHRR